MTNKKEFASYVCRHDGSFCLKGTLMAVKGGVALRTGIRNVDDLELNEILMLAHLCSMKSPASVDSIAYVTENEKSSVENILDRLSELGFVEEDGYAYRPSLIADELIFEVAKDLLEFDSLKYKQGLQEIESLQKKLSQ